MFGIGAINKGEYLNMKYQSIREFFSVNKKYITISILVLSIGLYFFQGINYSIHMHPMMDEGSYLLKGMYYLKGTYAPYQDYGPITNKPPFSFYSLGLSQLIEPGLRSGRYFAILLGIGVLIGLWFTIKRLFNVWWAAGIVLFTSISPALDHVFFKSHDTGSNIVINYLDALFHPWRRSKAVAALSGWYPGVITSSHPAEFTPIVFLNLALFGLGTWKKGLVCSRNKYYSIHHSIIIFLARIICNICNNIFT